MKKEIMMKLYGNDFSFNSNKVRFAANAMGIKYEFQSVNLAGGEQRKPEFLKLNPVGRIPTLIDGDVTIFESNTICRYLAEKINSALYPKDLKQHTLVNQWLDFGSIHIGGAMGKIFFNTIIYKFINSCKDDNSLKEGINFLTTFLGIVNDQLAKTPYIAGDSLTLADLNILASLDPCEVTGFDLSPFPKVVAWRKKLQAEKFYQDVFPSFTEFLNGVMQKA